MSQRRKGKMKPDAWMPVFIGDFLAGTSHLSTELRGAYLLILFAMWKNGARVPNDDEHLATVSGLGLKRWRAAKIKLTPFFLVEDSYLTQKRLKEEYDHAWSVYGKRVDSGKQGGRPRSAGLFDETERLQEENRTGNQNDPVRPPQSQSQSQEELLDIHAREESLRGNPPARALNGSSIEASKALCAAGIEVAVQNPYLEAALSNGITAEAIIALSRTAKGRGKGIAYLTRTLIGQKADAAAGSEQLVAKPTVDPEQAARAAEIERLEGSIYDARHLCDTSGLIDPDERDRRIKDAKAQIRALTRDQPA